MGSGNCGWSLGLGMVVFVGKRSMVVGTMIAAKKPNTTVLENARNQALKLV